MKTLFNVVTLGMSTLLLVVAAPLLAQPPGAGHEWMERETVQRDLGTDHFTAGGTVSVSRPVAGDLAAAGANVDVTAAVGGDALVTGGNVRLGASIKQDLYALGGRVSIDGAVQRNARLVGGTIEIGPQARIAGNVTVGGGEVRIAGAINGYLQAGGGHVVIDGTVGGDVEIAGGTIELGPNARIDGRLRYASRDELQRDPAAVVKGGTERFTPHAGWPGPSDAQKRAGRGAGWIWTAGLMLLAAILAAALPGVYAGVGVSARERWAMSLLVGFIALVCIPVAVLIALLSVIGAPLALLMIALYLALLLAGYVSAGIAVGAVALKRWQPARAAQTGWRVGAAVLGMLAISLLGRLPWIGALLMQIRPARAKKAR